jgi:CRP/FNR family transcriptional regulator
MQEVDFLKSVLIFQGLPKADLTSLAKSVTAVRFPRHGIIFKEGEKGDSLFILRQGLVKISKVSQDGRIKTLAILKPGQVFGEMSVFSDEPRTARAETLLETRALRLEKERFLALHRDHPAMGLQIIRTLVERLTQADRQIKNLALGNSRAKIADLLLMLYEEFGQTGGGRARVNVRLTHQEMADLAGLARETTTKLLNEFAKEGAIALADRDIEIREIGKLKEWVM